MTTDRSILLCDDEVEIAEELAELFESFGWRVRLCHSAAAAKRILLEAMQPHCLITDLRLDDADGTSLVAFARGLPENLRPKLHAIMTGYVVDDTTAEDLGVDALYLKPVDPFVLIDDIEKRLAKRGEPGSS
ncbi:response regulator [Amorphus sp. 3PC139-8]|uniref:response regulator n=1 Tax=Amorphus sp. 3PC139-8 TaxID=2735676 RepID=UPI00345D3807